MKTWGKLDSRLTTTFLDLSRVSAALESLSKTTNNKHHHDALMEEVSDILEDMSVITRHFSTNPAPPYICQKIQSNIKLIHGILEKSDQLKEFHHVVQPRANNAMANVHYSRL